MAANCISLKGSTTCPAFESASVLTEANSYVVGLLYVEPATDKTRTQYAVGLSWNANCRGSPFLQFVSSTDTFDQQLRSYLSTSYLASKLQSQWKCGGVNLTNTSDLYARFTTTVICNAIIQNSIDACGLSSASSRPLCADTCAQFAESEAYVAADKDLCPNPGSATSGLIRADFTTCSLPPRSLTNDCITGIANEPQNCGYGNSTLGLCSYCSSGGINATDTCCYNSDISNRCAGVVLPSITPTMTFATTSASPTASTPPASSSAVADPGHKGLSGGAIAGITIGSVLGVGFLAALLLLCCLKRRRKGRSQDGSIFNQPSPARRGASMSQSAPANPSSPGFEVLPGGRIARMSALEGPGDVGSHHGRDIGAGTAVGAAAGYAAGRRRNGDSHSSSDGFSDSPAMSERGGVLRPPPATMQRRGSLSSNSALGGEDPQSPSSAGDMSSPRGMTSGQSEQLPFFKDYYSQDDIHPGDRVAVLWAYQPRAADEFALDRGDMLKVVGIWDDGWATGVLTDERAEDWEARRAAQRDSGVSNTSGRGRDASPPISGEIKAFPLVCVCLPEHWRKTIEGDGSTETGSSAAHHTPAS